MPTIAADDPSDWPALAAVAAMRAGEISAAAYADALLARCASGAELNAFITLEPERVRAAAEAADRHRATGAELGSLHGLPIPVKDSINTRDLPTSAGTAALRAFRPAADAGIVARLRDAGAIVLGKTNLHELSFGWTSDNQVFGAVHNPWDRSRIAGGSSGGTAAAVAARMAPLGVAEDTQGSIRVPAALCGVCGFRPTTGRYPNDGAAPITPLFDQVGPHARCVGDLALFDAVVTGDARPIAVPALSGLRLGLDRDAFFAGLDAPVASVIDAVLARLADAGVELVDAPIDGVDAVIGSITLPVQLHDVGPSLTRYLLDHDAPVDLPALLAAASPDVGALLKQFALPGAPSAISAAVYEHARDVALPALRGQMAAWFAQHRLDAMLLPATMAAAPLLGAAATVPVNGAEIPFVTAIARNITLGSTAGLPGLVLPAGLTADRRLPVAIELDGPAGADRALLGIGLAIEAILDAMPAPPL